MMDMFYYFLTFILTVNSFGNINVGFISKEDNYVHVMFTF